MKEQTQNPAQTLKEKLDLGVLVACAKWPFTNFDNSANVAWFSYSQKARTVYQHFAWNGDTPANNCPVWRVIADNVQSRAETIESQNQTFKQTKQIIVLNMHRHLTKDQLVDFLSEMPTIKLLTEGETITGFEFEHFKSLVDIYQNRFTRSKPVRYFMGLGLTEYDSLALYETALDSIISESKGDCVHVMKEPEDPDSWEYLYSASSDFYSCMEGNDAVRAYANNEGCTLFYTTEDGKRFTGQKLTGRCIVNTKRKVYGRVYGESGLKGWLDQQGYKYCKDPLEGVLVNLEVYAPETSRRRTAFLMPYVDHCGGVGLDELGRVVFAYSANSNQVIDCTSTNGYVYLNMVRECMHCERKLGLNARVWKGANEGEGVCNACFESHFAYDRNDQLISLDNLLFYYTESGEVKTINLGDQSIDLLELAKPERAYCGDLDRYVMVNAVSRKALSSNEFQLFSCRLTGKIFSQRCGDYYTLYPAFYGDNNRVLEQYGNDLISVFSPLVGDYVRVLVQDTVRNAKGDLRYFLDYVQCELELI